MRTLHFVERVRMKDLCGHGREALKMEPDGGIDEPTVWIRDCTEANDWDRRFWRRETGNDVDGRAN